VTAISSNETTIRDDLSRAASYRFLSLLLSTPSEAARAELATLAREVEPTLAEDAPRLSEVSGAGLQGLYHRLLGASGQVPDVECAYDDNTAGGRGPLIADVAGFYRAFSYEHAGPNTADHVAAELDFLGWLSMKRAYARHTGAADRLEVTSSARAKFIHDHLGRWVMPFLERLAQAGEGTHYEAVAVLASGVLRRLEGDVFDRPNARMRLPVLDEPEDVETCG
jgi:TorA maturation chaperone TorD